jgi:hypothetical protein
MAAALAPVLSVLEAAAFFFTFCYTIRVVGVIIRSFFEDRVIAIIRVSTALTVMCTAQNSFNMTYIPSTNVVEV